MLVVDGAQQLRMDELISVRDSVFSPFGAIWTLTYCFLHLFIDEGLNPCTKGTYLSRHDTIGIVQTMLENSPFEEAAHALCRSLLVLDWRCSDPSL